MIGCSDDPITGKKQLMLVPKSAELRIDKENSPHQISSDYGRIQDDALNDYIREVGEAMAPLTHRPETPYSFQGVNATYINAYAFPGGTIAVTRGILLKLKNEAELAALLGHELGHVNARHTAEQMSKRTLTSLAVLGLKLYMNQEHSEYTELAGRLGILSAGALLATYSRANEREADALGNQYMVKAGCNTSGFEGLMEMLNGLSRRRPGIAEMLFATHPMSEERYRTSLRRSKAEYRASRDFPMNRERYMDHTAGLRAMKEMIENLQKGETSMNRGKFKHAESYLKKALKQKLRDYAGLVMMAKCQLAQNRFETSLKFAEAATKVYPGEALAYQLTGYARIKQKRYESAYRDFKRCDQLLPGNPALSFFKGYALEGMGRMKNAAREYRKYLDFIQEGSKARHAVRRLSEWQ